MAQEIPEYFLLKSGTHYIIAQAVVVVKQEVLPAAVTLAVGEAFDAAAATIAAIKLPSPYDPCDPCCEEGDKVWASMARMEPRTTNFSRMDPPG